MGLLWEIVFITALAGMGGTGLGGVGVLPVPEGFQPDGEPAAEFRRGRDDGCGMFLTCWPRRWPRRGLRTICIWCWQRWELCWVMPLSTCSRLD